MKKAPISWLNLSIFLITGLIALLLVPWYAFTVGFTLTEIVATILCLGFCGMSITAGYHRLWSHKTYDAHPLVKFVLAIGGAFALQNSILHWSSDHRNHHKHVDNNDRDPYSAKRGFWHSHIGWMLREYQGDEYKNYNNCKDLQKDKIVVWQHKYYVPLAIITNFGIPLAIGLITDRVIACLLSIGVLRLVLSHHFTFFINSLAHIWGKQTYTNAHTARDNAWLAFLTYGEGYHNFHHTFEYDYRNGIKWWHFDPTKWFIKSLSWLGLTHKLRTASEERIEQAKTKHKMQLMREHLTQHPHHHVLLEKLEAEYEILISRMSAFYTAKKQLIEFKKQKLEADYRTSDIYLQFLELKQKLNEQKQLFLKFNLTLQTA
ncbi:fatty acid desaturase [Catenovulum sp. 2E275]|uniref:acyl-CoA desaturase n=1 Tax=Catenovulum sp. 2E275 TaxID=2980497 RepID=UPI0021D188DF|nr:fatty acid desaturase [Catenovulum sp. 2E275]MCU4676381.1 fatty acid desaturase [Catenovulum sp. 2E275]